MPQFIEDTHCHDHFIAKNKLGVRSHHSQHTTLSTGGQDDGRFRILIATGPFHAATGG
jgi:hypothetical protein